MIAIADEPLQPRAANLLWAVVVTLALALVSTQCSCTASHPVARIALPSTAPVRTAVAVAVAHNDKAAASNARAVALALKAVQAGIAAGSQDAKDLAASTRDTGDELAVVKVQLTTANAEIDKLTAQLLAAQHQVDDVTKDRDAQRARADRAEKGEKAAEVSRGQWRFAFFVLLAAGVVLVSLLGIQLQAILRNTEAMAAHLALAAGRDVVGALEKVPELVGVAAKVAPLVALV